MGIQCSISVYVPYNAAAFVCEVDVEWYVCISIIAQQCMQYLSHISTAVRCVLIPTQHFTMLLCMDRDLEQGGPALVFGVGTAIVLRRKFGS